MNGSNVADINTGQAVQSQGGSGNGSGYGERLARIEARLDSIEKHGATKEDITKVKLWFLGGVLLAIGIAIPAAIGVAYTAARLFSE